MTELPAVLLAWRKTADDLAASPDERLQEDWHAVGHLLVWMEGHGGCGGWTFHPRDRQLVCACGAVLFEAEAVA